MTVRYDLHLHTALSPCGEERMTPNNIVNMALLAELDLIAVTDHNACGNCRAAMEIGKRMGLAVLPGMELTTSEEAHVVCLFPTICDAERFEREEVRPGLLQIRNDPKVFGRQLFMDADDRVTGEEETLLITATGISAEHVQALCKKHNGAAIPAHIDKEAYSLLSALGYLDPAMDFPVCEITHRCDEKALRAAHPELENVEFIRNSDAHDLGLIGLEAQTLELPRADAETVIRYFSRKTKGGNR